MTTSVIQPFGAVVLDITEYTDTLTKQKMYNSILTFFLDSDGESAMSFMTDVHTSTYLDCIEKTLKPLSLMFANISAEVTVFDLNTSVVLNSLNLNDLYPNGFDPSGVTESEERPKYLH